jgi:serine/threonine protein phosphatase PrpC
MGTSQVPREAHFVYDYMFRRVPVPVTSFLAIADSSEPLASGQNASRVALDLLKDALEPAVITEDEMTRESMQKMFSEAFGEVSSSLLQQGGAASAVSMTVVLSDRKRAFIAQVGSGKVYLLHDERLYDLTPSGQVATPPAQPEPQPAPVQPVEGGQVQAPLFPVGEGAPGPPAPVAPTAPAVEVPAPAPYEPRLGTGVQVIPGYNEVEMVPGDILILCTDGLWNAVKEDELVENFLSAMNVQRAVSQVTQLALNRDPSDNATCVAWQYVVPSEKWTTVVRETKARERRSHAADGVLMIVLIAVLALIFAAGFAFGWRITDTFRKDQKVKDAAKRAAAAKIADQKKKAAEAKAAEEKAAQQSATQPAQQTATVVGAGVRLRATPDPAGNIVGLLTNGEVVVVLGQATGTDSKAWSKVQATVTSGTKTIPGEGYVRNDLLNMGPAPASSAPAASTPAASTPAASSTAPKK